MNDQSALQPVIRQPGQGDVLRAFGEEVIVHLGGAQTGGKLRTLIEIRWICLERWTERLEQTKGADE